MSYDPRCLELAEVFLEDTPSRADKAGELAQVIQDAIEAWLDDGGFNYSDVHDCDGEPCVCRSIEKAASRP